MQQLSMPIENQNYEKAILQRGPQPSIQIELPQWLALGGVLRLAQRLSELFLEQVFLVLFRLDRLPEDRLLALVVITHRLGRRLQILKRPLARRRRVAHHQAGGSIDPEHRPAIGARNFENMFLCFRHFLLQELYALRGPDAQWDEKR